MFDFYFNCMAFLKKSLEHTFSSLENVLEIYNILQLEQKEKAKAM